MHAIRRFDVCGHAAHQPGLGRALIRARNCIDFQGALAAIDRLDSGDS